MRLRILLPVVSLMLVCPLAPRAVAGPAPTTPSSIILKLRSGTVDDAQWIVTSRWSDSARTAAPAASRLRPVLTSTEEGRARRRARGLTLTGLDGFYVVELPPGLSAESAAALLAQDPRVELAQPDYLYEMHAVPDDPFYHSRGSWGQPYDDLWNLKKLDMERAWDVTKGEGTVVAVVDTGIAPDERDLQANVADPNTGFFGYDFVDPGTHPSDEHSHGTLVAGIIAAVGDNGEGIVGVAPRARLRAARVADYRGVATSARVAAGIAWAAEQGAHVINSSGGCTARCPSNPIVEHAVRYALSLGSVVVVSAGNGGDDLAFYSPQNMVDPRPIVVAATDHLDQRESFSNYGAFVDLGAPGGGVNAPPPAYKPQMNIISVHAGYCGDTFDCDLRFFGGRATGYSRLAGTSMAAAHVSGVAALLRAADPSAGVETIRHRLFANALDLGPGGYDPMFGWGRLTGYASLADETPYLMARLLAPASNERVSGVVRIVGSAAARSFSRYEISVGRGAAPATWQTAGVTLAGGMVRQGELGRWNTRTLANGVWTIRLVVHGAAGPPREQRRTVTVDNTALRHALSVEVVGVANGLGSVLVEPTREFCANVAGARQRCLYGFNDGATVTLTPSPGRLSTFTGWSGACTGMGPCRISMTEPRSVTATFRGPHFVTLILRSFYRGEGSVHVAPQNESCSSGSGEPVTCVYAFAHGSTAILSGNPGPMTSFSWMPNDFCVHSFDPCRLLMNRDYAIGGSFSRPNNPPSVDPGPPQTVELGTTVTLSGSASDDEGDAITAYFWFHYVDGQYIQIATEPEVQVSGLALGEHQFLLVAYAGDSPGQGWTTVTVVPAGSARAVERNVK